MTEQIIPCSRSKSITLRASINDICTYQAVLEIEGEQGTEGDTSRRGMELKICFGAPILATNSYKKNPDSPLGNEIDLQQGDALSYIMEHEDT